MHLGLPNPKESLKREKKIIQWLDYIKKDASDLFLVGDIFEFWFEWKYVIPKHFSRFFGKIAELSDAGIKIHYFTGNHDIWAYNYFKEEFNINIYKHPATFSFFNKKFFIAHGDGLGPGDKLYKKLKKIFTNKFLQWAVAKFVHPNALFKLALKISYQRDACNKKPKFKNDKEWLIQYAKEKLKHEHFDFFIFGHRHIAQSYQINNSQIIYLGDWINNFSFAQFDGKELKLNFFQTQNTINQENKNQK